MTENPEKQKPLTNESSDENKNGMGYCPQKLF